MQFNEWCLVPGPETLNQPLMSFDCDEVAEYPIEDMTDAILSFPGTSLEREGSWWDWRAIWRDGQHYIRVDMTLLDGESPVWGGSRMDAICTLEKVMELWQHLRSQFPGVWMHDSDGMMHTPESFLRHIEESP